MTVTLFYFISFFVDFKPDFNKNVAAISKLLITVCIHVLFVKVSTAAP